MATSTKFLCFFIIVMELTFCQCNVLIGKELSKEKQYRIDLEIFKQIDRFYTTFRRAKAWKNYEMSEVKSHFNFLEPNDNIAPELKHYMNFIGVLNSFFNNLTISFSILYTKYTAMYHALHLLNHYKFRKDNPVGEDDSEILIAYLQISQYLAWYACTGNNAVQEAIKISLRNKPLALEDCAIKPYLEFESALNNFFNEVYEYLFMITDDPLEGSEYYDDFWEIFFDFFRDDITIINRYFIATFTGNRVEKIEKEDFLQIIQIGNSIEKIVDDLLAMKGRDIDETYFNFDNYAKKDMREVNVTSVMRTIENHFMEAEAINEKQEAESNEKLIILRPVNSDQAFTCLKFELVDHDLVTFDDNDGSAEDEDILTPTMSQ